MTNHCTYAQAIALKEIGFDMEVRDYFWSSGNKGMNFIPKNYNKYPATISAPTRSEVLQWAREKKGIHGWIEPFVNHLFNRWTFSITEENVGLITHGTQIYPTYPEAEDALIDKIIELIKNK